jgi:hypothetical protein
MEISINKPIFWSSFFTRNQVGTMQGLRRFVNMLYWAQEHEGPLRLTYPPGGITTSEIEDLCGPIDWTSLCVHQTLIRWSLSLSRAGIVRGLGRRHSRHTLSSSTDSAMDLRESDQSRSFDQPPLTQIKEEPTPSQCTTLTQPPTQNLPCSVPRLIVTPRDPVNPKTPTLTGSLSCEPAKLSGLPLKKKKNVIVSDESDDEQSESSCEMSSDSSESDDTETYGYASYMKLEDIEVIRYQGKSYWPLARTIAYLTGSPSGNDNSAARKIMTELPGGFKSTKAQNMYVVDTTRVIALRNSLCKRKMLDFKAWSKFCKHNGIQAAIRSSK